MLYTKFKEALFKGIAFNLITDTIKVALLTQGYVPNEADEFFSDISAHEVVATGYVAGGQALANKSLVTSDKQVTFDADDPLWNITGQLSALYAVVYKDTGNPATSRLIVLKEFVYLRTVINDSFTPEWGPNGIILLR